MKKIITLMMGFFVCSSAIPNAMAGNSNVYICTSEPGVRPNIEIKVKISIAEPSRAIVKLDGLAAGSVFIGFGDKEDDYFHDVNEMHPDQNGKRLKLVRKGKSRDQGLLTINYAGVYKEKITVTCKEGKSEISY